MSASKPIIAWNNLLELGTVVASTEATGYEKENAYDGLTHDAWKPSATGLSTLDLYLSTASPVDCFGGAVHNLGTNAGSIKLQYSDDGVTWTDLSTLIEPTDDGPFFQTFTSVTKSIYRVRLTSTPASYIGALFIGARLDLERGVRSFQVPKLGRDYVAIDSDSQTGQFLGRSVIRQGAKSVLSLSNLSAAWVRANWADFMEYAQSKPFFMSWDNGDHATEVAFCRASKPVKAPYNDNLLMDSTVEMDCIISPATVTPELRDGSLAGAVAPATLSAVTGNLAGEIELTWPAGVEVLTYNVYRADTAGGALTLLGNTASLTYSDTTVGANATTRYYKVKSVNALGESASVSPEASAATLAVSAPASTTAVTGDTQGEVEISWPASASATKYNVYEATSSGGSFSIVGADVVGTSYSRTGLAANTQRYYKIKGANALGESALFSPEDDATTLPDVISDLAATAISTSQIDLAWTAIVGATSYKIYWELVSGGIAGVYQLAASGNVPPSYSHTGLLPGTAYYYVVRATSGAGDSANSNEATATTL